MSEELKSLGINFFQEADDSTPIDALLNFAPFCDDCVSIRFIMWFFLNFQNKNIFNSLIIP